MQTAKSSPTLTAHQAQYFAHELTSRKASNQLEKLTSTLSNAQVDLNPPQIEAALFAFKSPLSKGAILADEDHKLDKWADDMKSALELDIKKLDIEVKTTKTNAKKILRIEDKLALQREVKNMEKPCNELRSRLFTTQDEIENRKDSLIERVERQLHQRSEAKRLFTIHWNIV